MHEPYRHGDAFAGIGGFGLAARNVGWKTVWACEIEPSARSVYAARLGSDGLRFDFDIRESRDLPPIDVLTGGFPCQDLSVAGKRAGLAGNRSGLFFELVRLLEVHRPEWFVFENVPGLLSSEGGEDMALVIGELTGCFPEPPADGWSAAGLAYGPRYSLGWRVLNSRFFGVAQNRERVFLVGHRSGSPDYPATVLFDETGEEGDSEANATSRSDVEFALTARTHKGGDPTTDTYVVGTIQGGGNRGYRVGAEEARGGQLVTAHTLRENERNNSNPGCANYIVSRPLVSGGNDKQDLTRNTYLVAHALTSAGFDASEDGSGRGTPIIAPTLRCGGMADAKRPAGAGSDNVALSRTQTPAIQSVASALGKGGGKPGQGYPCVTAALHSPSRAARVRASTRISGPLDVCPACIEGPDSPRYRGLGNAVTEPVVRWILGRIERMRTDPQPREPRRKDE